MTTSDRRVHWMSNWLFHCKKEAYSVPAGVTLTDTVVPATEVVVGVEVVVGLVFVVALVLS